MRTRSVVLAAITTMLMACGNGDDQATSTATDVAQLSGTLAYIASACRETPDGIVMRETLWIQRGENAPVEVVGFEALGRGVFTKCFLSALGRSYDTQRFGAFPRLAVSPDGTRVAFELSDDFSEVLHGALPAEAEGFFVVDGDGAVRSLGPPSREPAYFVNEADTTYGIEDFKFTPDGRAITFTDKRGDSDGNQATQIMLMEVVTGDRRQLTHLPPTPDLPPGAPAIALLTFLDNATLGFVTAANPDGLNPEADAAFSVRTDGSGLELLSAATTISGATIDPRFRITGDQPTVGIVSFPLQEPEGPPVSSTLLGVQEVFLRDGDDLLQLTNFHRADTFAIGRLSRDGQRIYFNASANPIGSNPTENCQLFSIDRTGADTRQVTNFSESEEVSSNGCSIFLWKPFGCFVELAGEDAATGTLVFRSNCDHPALGTNPNGSQMFAVRPDGTGLRQLTYLAGRDADGNGGEGLAVFAFAGQAPGH